MATHNMESLYMYTHTRCHFLADIKEPMWLHTIWKAYTCTHTRCHIQLKPICSCDALEIQTAKNIQCYACHLKETSTVVIFSILKDHIVRSINVMLFGLCVWVHAVIV